MAELTRDHMDTKPVIIYSLKRKRQDFQSKQVSKTNHTDETTLSQ